MKFEIEASLRGAPDEELLEDIRSSGKAINRNTITRAEYEKVGKAHPSTIHRRFGSWAKALDLAGLQPSRSKYGITDEELFENIKSLWISLGRQPKYSEVKSPLSIYSAGTYENRFGSWIKALYEFVTWINSYSTDEIQQSSKKSEANPQSRCVMRRTRREISDRQRFRILLRDGFRCTACGASPLKDSNIELHVDHVLPWSQGGETTDDNLTTKCKQCNLGKGNTFEA